MIEYEEDWLPPLLFRFEGSVACRASRYAVPSAVIAVLLCYLEEWSPGKQEELGFNDLAGGHIWNAATGICMFDCPLHSSVSPKETVIVSVETVLLICID